jgi:hypothetical protein
VARASILSRAAAPVHSSGLQTPTVKLVHATVAAAARIGEGRRMAVAPSLTTAHAG